ncbi:MAG: hypothetical protein A3I68_01570 [Candidatus Melainabacteria bacterium RIFCSPLOWO2_02_FULL_35_15]|nr:MAG: hypothetical protein A3F80_04880 [Candidatus Melainabacteria bacterium RIFCSPLOWO2_12_FULL_35_11]OGI12999.1 MAG: hypothetical protein A3I68_01570 [Candidatus Melainabacteria bacterium RIFCSPLOWO2_02_FULL_35_15]
MDNNKKKVKVWLSKNDRGWGLMGDFKIESEDLPKEGYLANRRNRDFWFGEINIELFEKAQEVIKREKEVLAQLPDYSIFEQIIDELIDVEGNHPYSIAQNKAFGYTNERRMEGE